MWKPSSGRIARGSGRCHVNRSRLSTAIGKIPWRYAASTIVTVSCTVTHIGASSLALPSRRREEEDREHLAQHAVERRGHQELLLHARDHVDHEEPGEE